MKEKQIEDFMLPTNDYVFKRLFGYAGNESFSQIVLTPFLEIVIISIKRFEKMKKENIEPQNRDISSWIRFIKDPNSLEEKDMENKEIKKAKEEYNNIIEDDKERRLAELRMKYIMDMKSIKNTGFHDGEKIRN